MCDKCFRPRHWGKTCAEMEEMEIEGLTVDEISKALAKIALKGAPDLDDGNFEKWVAFTRIITQSNLLIDQLINIKILFDELCKSADNLKNDLEKIKPPKRKIEIKCDHKPR